MNKKSEDSRPKAARLVSVNSMPRNAVSQTAMSDYKLHLVMDKESYARLLWLKASLEASTDSEVIRRALQAYEIFEPSDADQKEGVQNNLSAHLANESAEHLYIRIPQRIKERLDAERETSGLSYGEQVRQALRVLMQFAREREKVLQYVKCAGDADIDSEVAQEQSCCELSKKLGESDSFHRVRAIC